MQLIFFLLMQDQVLTDEIKELNRKVLKQWTTTFPRYVVRHSNFDSSTLLQGNLTYQENLKLHKKFDILCQENAELRKKVLLLSIRISSPPVQF